MTNMKPESTRLTRYASTALCMIAQLLAPLLIQLPAKAAEFFFEKDPSLPLVYVTAAFRGGSAHDPDSKNGATQMMGHLMLRGTKSKTKQQIDLALDQMGASIGFETRAEFCAFRGSVLSENLPAFLSLLQEILTSPSFRSQELEKLRAEQISMLLNELNQDRSLVRLRFDEVFFKGHPYAKPNSGKIRDIQTLTVGDLQRHYQNLVTSNNLILLAAGDSSESDYASFLRGMNEKSNAGSTLSPVPEFRNPPSGTRIVIFDKPDRSGASREARLDLRGRELLQARLFATLLESGLLPQKCRHPCGHSRGAQDDPGLEKERYYRGGIQGLQTEHPEQRRIRVQHSREENGQPTDRSGLQPSRGLLQGLRGPGR
ncbi:insulinase family protein [bacterium]|nr:insulinase family protein [bacterium]